MAISKAESVSRRRRKTKTMLVEHHGGKCYDCGAVLPPFMYEFDHREPKDKAFGIRRGVSYSYDRQLEESLKCDMICPNCHRWRTHRQRCKGCEYCRS